MVALKGVTVTVDVNGQPLTEFLDGEANNTQTSTASTTCHVESKVGERFTINITCAKSAFQACRALVANVFVDGTSVIRPLLEVPRTLTWRVIGPEERKDGKWLVQPMYFADLQISEDDASRRNPRDVKKQVESLGTISVTMRRVKKQHRVKEPSVEHKELSKSLPVSEKALKGLALDTKIRFSYLFAFTFALVDVLGEAQRHRKLNIYKCETIDTKESPFLTFNFKYRSRKALQSMLIIPRAPSPGHEQLRAITSLSREELVASVSTEDLIGLLQRRTNQAPVKREVKAEVKNERIKRERDEETDEILSTAQPSKKKARTSKVEVIDLFD